MEKEPAPEGRKRQAPKEMDSDSLATAFGLATKLRAQEVEGILDVMLKKWLEAALDELRKRNELDQVREYLPVYFDPSRRVTVFGPGAELTSQGAIERAIHPSKPVRAIAG